MLDLEGRASRWRRTSSRLMQRMKTGALIRYACEAGAILAGVSVEDRAVIVRYGETIGLGFQVADDLLDLTSDAATLGKAAKKDADRGKATLPALYGIEASKAMLAGLVAEAEALVAPSGSRGAILAETARFIAERQNSRPNLDRSRDSSAAEEPLLRG